MTYFGLIILAFALILLNAFFVAAEFSIVRLRQTQISPLTKRSALSGKVLTYIHKHLDVYLSACQVGVTLASLGLGWVGEPAFAGIFAPFFSSLRISGYSSEIIAFVLAFSLISFLHIVIGELMPKSMAIQKTEQISLLTAVPLYIFYWIMYPAIWLLNRCSNSLLKIFRLNNVNGDSFYSTEEIKLILHSSFVHGEITKDEADIMARTLEFADLRITEIMRPADELVTIDVHATFDEAIKIVLSTSFSRYPVTDKNKIIGFVHVKDIFAGSYRQNEQFNLKKLLRPTMNVQHNVPSIEILRQFRKIGTHFGLIYRKRQLIGFVTLDNLLHVIIGRIKDEFHKTDHGWQENLDGSFTGSGDCTIYALERVLHREIEDNEKYHIDNIYELIMHRLGYLPPPNTLVNLEDFSFKITALNTDGFIDSIIIYPNKPQAATVE